MLTAVNFSHSYSTTAWLYHTAAPAININRGPVASMANRTNETIRAQSFAARLSGLFSQRTIQRPARRDLHRTAINAAIRVNAASSASPHTFLTSDRLAVYGLLGERLLEKHHGS